MVHLYDARGHGSGIKNMYVSKMFNILAGKPVFGLLIDVQLYTGQQERNTYSDNSKGIFKLRAMCKFEGVTLETFISVTNNDNS